MVFAEKQKSPVERKFARFHENLSRGFYRANLVLPEVDLTCFRPYAQLSAANLTDLGL